MPINRKEIYLPKNKYTDHILHLFQIWICVLLSWTLLRKLPSLYLLSKKHSHFNKGKHQSTLTMSDVYKPPQHFHNVSHCSSMEQVSLRGQCLGSWLINSWYVISWLNGLIIYFFFSTTKCIHSQLKIRLPFGEK